VFYTKLLIKLCLIIIISLLFISLILVPVYFTTVSETITIITSYLSQADPFASALLDFCSRENWADVFQAYAIPAAALFNNPANPKNELTSVKGQLGAYLAGYLESDGTLVTPKPGSKNTPKISIVFNIKDKNLAVHLMKVLGYGTIQVNEAANCVYLDIRSKAGILDIIYLINGKFRQK